MHIRSLLFLPMEYYFANFLVMIKVTKLIQLQRLLAMLLQFLLKSKLRLFGFIFFVGYHNRQIFYTMFASFPVILHHVSDRYVCSAD